VRSTTAEALVAVNRRFYRERAAAFAAHREGPWPGFSRVLARLPEGPVLDVGCGEGRFGVALARVRPQTPYTGVDLSPTLLRRARARRDLPARTRLVALDCARHPEALLPGPFAGVVALGLLHHVPGEARRTALLAALAARLAPGGVLGVTLWRFRSVHRLARLELAWDGVAVDPTDLEPGDALLSFAGDARVPRYCHFVDDAEAERLVAALAPPGGAVELLERFRADGREGELNEYVLVRRRP
jgi:SAM-dependent methyltransferase